MARTALFGHLSDAGLERLILALLLGIGVALVVEGFLPGGVSAILPELSVVWILASGTAHAAHGISSDPGR